MDRPATPRSRWRPLRRTLDEQVRTARYVFIVVNALLTAAIILVVWYFAHLPADQRTVSATFAGCLFAAASLLPVAFAAAVGVTRQRDRLCTLSMAAAVTMPLVAGYTGWYVGTWSGGWEVAAPIAMVVYLVATMRLWSLTEGRDGDGGGGRGGRGGRDDPPGTPPPNPPGGGRTLPVHNCRQQHRPGPPRRRRGRQAAPRRHSRPVRQQNGRRR